MERILDAAGKEIAASYHKQTKEDPNALLLVLDHGHLPCKKIFVSKWVPSKDKEDLQRSLADLVGNVIQHVIAHQCASIALPAIGCGKHGCSVDVVVKTMVCELKEHLRIRNLPLKVKIVIEASQKTVYEEFCTRILPLHDSK